MSHSSSTTVSTASRRRRGRARALDRLPVDVGDTDRPARADEQLDEMRADVARPLHDDPPPGQRRLAVDLRAAARIAASTPTAVTGDGSPDPPGPSMPVTHGVSSASPFMSAGVAPTSSAAM